MFIRGTPDVVSLYRFLYFLLSTLNKEEYTEHPSRFSEMPNGRAKLYPNKTLTPNQFSTLGAPHRILIRIDKLYINF